MKRFRTTLLLTAGLLALLAVPANASPTQVLSVPTWSWLSELSGIFERRLSWVFDAAGSYVDPDGQPVPEGSFPDPAGQPAPGSAAVQQVGSCPDPDGMPCSPQAGEGGDIGHIIDPHG